MSRNAGISTAPMPPPRPPLKRAARSIRLALKPYFNPVFYELAHGVFTPEHMGMFNWGYAPADAETRDAAPHQPLQAQLYKQTFGQLDRALSADETLCEISCGQGAGLAFIARSSDVRVIGLERSALARRRARRRHGLDVRKTNGPAISLPDGSVDVFLSVEAAHNYLGEAFTSELRRCLRPGGTLLMTDLCDRPHPREHVCGILEAGGFRLANWQDITANVMAALAEDDARKTELIARLPRVLQKRGHEFACTLKSEVYRKFTVGERTYYMLMAVRKEA